MIGGFARVFAVLLRRTLGWLLVRCHGHGFRASTRSVVLGIASVVVALAVAAGSHGHGNERARVGRPRALRLVV